MKQKCILLSAQSWSLTDENGKQKSGLKLQYILSDSLSPVTSNDFYGHKVVSESVPADLLPQINIVPGLYQLEFALKVVRNKPQLAIDSLEFVEELI